MFLSREARTRVVVDIKWKDFSYNCASDGLEVHVLHMTKKDHYVCSYKRDFERDDQQPSKYMKQSRTCTKGSNLPTEVVCSDIGIYSSRDKSLALDARETQVEKAEAQNRSCQHYLYLYHRAWQA